jgi:hypothetical protein
MFQPPPEPTSTTTTREIEEEDYFHPQSPYMMAPPPPQPAPRHEGMLDGISKSVLILIFVAFIFGLMLGKSLTPIVLKG